MSRTNTAELILGANTQRLRQGLQSGSRDIQNFSTRTKTMLAGLGASLKRNLLSIPGQLGLIGGTAGLFMLGRNIIKFDEQMNRLGITGNMTKAALLGLREETFRVALQAGKSRADIVSGMDQIIERTGNVKFAVDTFKDLTIAARATGAEMADLGGLASQLDEKLGIKPEGLMSALDILTGQGKAGAFTLQNLAGLGARLFSSAARLNMAGEAGVAQIGALSQIAMTGTGTPELATTAVERTLSNLISNEAKVKALGVKTRDALGKWLPITQVLKDVIVKTKGDEAKLEKLFGDIGIRLMSQLAASFRTTGKFERLDEFLFGDFKGTIDADFKKAMQSITAQLGRTLALAEKIGESSMLPTLEKLNRYMQELLDNPEKLVELDNKFKAFGKTISGLADAIAFLAKHWKILLGGFALFKGFGFAKSLGLFGGGKGSALGGIAGAAGAGVPVMVTNWPGMFGGGGLRSGTSIAEIFGGGASGAGASSGGLLAGLTKFIPQVAIAAGIIAAGYYGIKKLNEAGEEYQRKHFKRETGTLEDIYREFAPGYRDKNGAPPVSLNVPISVKVDIDKNGGYSGSANVNSPPGVDTATHLEGIFVGGDR